MENVCHCLWWHAQEAKLPSKPMEVLEQEAKNCRITAARTNLPFIIFSTFLGGQDQLFHFSGTGKAGKEETGVSPSENQSNCLRLWFWKWHQFCDAVELSAQGWCVCLVNVRQKSTKKFMVRFPVYMIYLESEKIPLFYWESIWKIFCAIFSETTGFLWLCNSKNFVMIDSYPSNYLACCQWLSRTQSSISGLDQWQQSITER